MQQKLIMLAVLLLAITPVSAMYAGETAEIMHFDQCTELNVKVNASLFIDQGEYSFVGCLLLYNETWSCPCYDGYDLVLSTTPMTVNSYTIIAEYAYKTPQQPTTKHKSKGFSWVSVQSPPEVEPVEPTDNATPTGTTTSIEPEPEPEPEPVTTTIIPPSPPVPAEPAQEPKYWLYGLFVVLGIIALCGVGYGVWYKFTHA